MNPCFPVPFSPRFFAIRKPGRTIAFKREDLTALDGM